MASQKLTALPSLAGGQAPTDLAYVVDVSAGTSGSKSSTLNDLFSIITKNITDGALRFAGFSAPSVSAAGAGAIYFDSASNTFQGSRNAGAYQNLLFGSGANERISVWGSGADQITSYATFQFNPASFSGGNNVCRITGNGIDGNFWVENTSATNPSYAVLNINGRTLLRRLQTGAPPFIDLSFGRAVASFPQSLDVLGYTQFTSTNNVTTNESVSLKAAATQNHTSSAAGAAFEIWNTRLNQVAGERRAIFGAGPGGATVLLAPSGSYTATTNVGTSCQVAVGFITTVDNLANVIISNQTVGLTSKTLVLQAVSGQTGNLFEIQSSAGAALYSISSAGAISSGSLTVTGSLSLAGSSAFEVFAGIAAPAVSAAGTGRIYFDSTSNTFKASQNGAAYTDIIGGGGSGTVNTGTAGQFTYYAANGTTVSGTSIITVQASNSQLLGLANGTRSLLELAQNGTSQITLAAGGGLPFLLALHVADGDTYNSFLYYNDLSPNYILNFPNNDGGLSFFVQEKGTDTFLSGFVVDPAGAVVLDANALPVQTLASAGYHEFEGVSAPAVAPAGKGRIYFDSGANKFKVSENGGAYVNLI